MKMPRPMIAIAAALLASVPAAALAAPNWQSFVDETLESFFRIEPSNAVNLGRHEFDGKLPDWSDAGLKAEIAFFKDVQAKAKTFDDRSLTPEQRLERDYLIVMMSGLQFWMEDADQPHTNPAYYLNWISPSIYATRPYAPPAERMKAMTIWADNVPAAIANIRRNLKTPMPVSFVDYGVSAYGGFAEYLSGPDARAPFAEVKDAAAKAKFEASLTKAAAAFKGLSDWIESQRATANKTGFVLGADRFARMLKATELVDTPLDELERIGRADLARNQAALKDACAQYAPRQTIEACMAKVNADKPQGGPVEGARAQLAGLKQFIIDRKLVTVPGTEEALVDEAPAYNRQNFAYIEIPGPYEKGLPSTYYIAPPDPSWSKEVQDGFVPGKADLLFTSVHEVWPGHFLQFLHANRVKSKVGRVFVGYAYAEGWGHYTEEMMWEAGLDAGSPETHIGQLSNALLRNCRYLSAIGLHARGMTQEQSYDMFRTQCYQDEGNARQQAARGTYDPAYLNYTLGKLMIRKLREDWTASRGGQKAWRDFHDACLSFGGPPIPLVRQSMLGEEKPKSAF
ncbi:DUF885 domain-containing protein [Sphingomonas sp. ID0503]|uniref:DUF885 domain-containing protein n=1 Tax=Sphingomonas sp. ID0503 TaxID=3399691 RepID=UPI003AFAA4AF